MRKLLTLLALVMSLLATALVAQAAPGDAGLNARLIRWQESDSIVHIFPQTDAGNVLSGTAAHVSEGQPLLFGFEWALGEATPEEREALMAGKTMTVSVDGGAPIDVTSSFLEEFYADGSGAPWTWDHDADGPGDGDNDGIGDFAGWIRPFRWEHKGLTAGTHTFFFEHFDSSGTLFTDTVTIVVSS